MRDDGGRANEPTSYGLRPPEPAPVPQQKPYEPKPYAPTQQQRPDGTGDGTGRLLGGRYRLVGRLGHGGMGTVWRARDEVVDREVAVKEPRVPDHLGERERANVYLRMQREARAAARIDHPCVVTVHDVVMEDGKPWIVMELVRGQSLADRLQEGTLDVREAARIGLAVLGALSAAHEAGVLHRDVKPDNVLLGRGDRVVLTDFGIAQVEGEQGLTETGAFVGSPEFIAPERVLGQRPGPESDLWSLGVVLYAAVEGMSPYRRSNTPATLQAVLSAEPQMPARGSGAFGTLVMQLLRKDPAARPGAAEIRATLEPAAAPAPLAATRLYAGDGAPTGGSRWVPPVLVDNRKAQLGLGGGVLAAAVAVVLLLASPFGGGGLPAGWQVRPENEVLHADVTVPDDYARTQGTDGDNVNYKDPSAVFQIYVDRLDPATDKTHNTLPADPGAWKTYYEKGGRNGIEFTNGKVTTATVKHQGRQAYDIVTDYTPNSASSDPNPTRYRYHELLVPGQGTAYWRLRVSMPAAGKAAKDGEELFTRVADGLKIHDL
ncbi:serine/threonine-protein kinase [Streptomyces violascens]|uniref:non-specific serine/threonine protein kinase n=1 Tax=Streptomyces violascens TaxID=67381 RepID=A0ABQ3R196_9ACTN|nr:serine/threonine-protein kinase [Streptomyces violascens]GGU10634.1 protein kinase [Streptomyces violascens]GHI43304.1 protein kinase [Streptomyces violascens]